MGLVPANERNANATNDPAADATTPFAIHLLDVGPEQYGDALLCQFGNISVLIDGAHRGNYKASGSHPSIPDQIGELLKQPGPTYTVDLLVISHLHDDHIGCFPELVQEDWLRAKYALVIDPIFRWGSGADEDMAGASDEARRLLETLSEEPRFDIDDDSLADLMADSGGLQQRYTEMLATLAERKTTVLRYGTQGIEALKTFLNDNGVGLEILGPRESDLPICARHIREWSQLTRNRINTDLAADTAAGPLSLYRQYVNEIEASDGRPRSSGSFINLESLVMVFKYAAKNFLFTGDMQLADAETDDPDLRSGREVLLAKIKENAPYAFVKLAHHGSWNGLSEEVLSCLKGSPLVGLCTGSDSGHHPDPGVLKLLEAHQANLNWVRTDRNGRVTLTFHEVKPGIALSSGKLNDASPPVAPKAKPKPGKTGASQLRAPGTEQFSFLGREGVIGLSIPKRAARVTITIDLAKEN